MPARREAEASLAQREAKHHRREGRRSVTNCELLRMVRWVCAQIGSDNVLRWVRIGGSGGP